MKCTIYYGGNKVNLSQHKEFINKLAELEHDVRFMRSMLEIYQNADVSDYYRKITLSSLNEALKNASMHFDEMKQILCKMKQNI